MTRQHLQIALLLIWVSTCFPFSGSGKVPVSIDSVDYSRIRYKKIRKLISRQKEFGIRTFDELHPVCYNLPDSGMYRTFSKSRLIRQDINIVWDNLTKQPPSEEFDGRIVTFGLLYSKATNDLVYKNEANTGLEEGQVLFFNLRVLSGIKNLAVAMEVTSKNNEAKIIEYCYVDHGETKGTQKFYLNPTPEGFTQITQMTKYKCNSRLRDLGLYAFFHERIVNEFFNSIKKKSEISLLVTNEVY